MLSWKSSIDLWVCGANRPDEKSPDTDWNKDAKHKTHPVPVSCLGSWWRLEVKPGEVGKLLPAPAPARAAGDPGWGQQSRWAFTTALGVPTVHTPAPSCLLKHSVMCKQQTAVLEWSGILGNLLTNHACSSTPPQSPNECCKTSRQQNQGKKRIGLRGTGKQRK